MSTSVMASVTKNWSDRRGGAPLWRAPFPLMIVISLGLMPNVAFSAWLSPELERVDNCTIKRELLASELKELSTTSTLYVTHIRDDQESETAKLFRERGLAGEIAYRPVYPTDTEVKDSQSMQLTGVVYRRESSSLEKFFSNTERQLYYEVKMEGEQFALNISSFKSQPFEVCI